MESSAAVATSPRTRPFEPYVAGVNAFLLSPIAGAVISYVNLKRLGNPIKANKILAYTIPAAVIEFWILMQLHDASVRFAGLGIAVASYKVFTFIQEPDVAAWEKENPGSKPRGFWSGIGWSVVGLAATLAVALPIAYILD